MYRLIGQRVVQVRAITCGFLILLCGCEPEVTLCEVPSGMLSRVSSQGSSLVYGVNSYPLYEHIASGNQDAVLDIFAQARSMGRGIIRTPAFFDDDLSGRPSLFIRDANGTVRQDGLKYLDRLLALARDHHIGLVLQLTNYWPDYGGIPAMLRALMIDDGAKDAFWDDERARALQRLYIETLANRVNHMNGRVYREDATIVAWELVNEARCDDARHCDDGTLLRWARNMAGHLRLQRVQQLIAWGGEGVYVDDVGWNVIAQDHTVDVMTEHLFMQRAVSPDMAISQGMDRIAEHTELAFKYGVRLWLEEMGWKTRDGFGSSDDQRVKVLGAWQAEAHRRCVGTFAWMIGEQGRPDYDGYLISPFMHPKTVEMLTISESTISE